MDNLEKLKKTYLKTETPQYLIYSGWSDLKFKLEDQHGGSIFNYLTRRSIALAGIIITFMAATTIASQTAKPGNALYSVKIASEKVYSLVTGNNTKQLENRTQDIIDLTGGDDVRLNKAVKEYEQTIDDTKNRVQDEEDKQKFRQTLDDSERKLNQAQSQDRDTQEKINQALEKTREAQGEVKGEKDRNQNENRNIPSQNNSQQDQSKESDRGHDK